MLAQIQEATEMMKEVADLGPIIKILVALAFLQCFCIWYLFKKLLEQIEKGHERDKVSMEVLSATNKIMEQNIRERAQDTSAIRADIQQLHVAIMYKPTVPHL